MRPRRRWDLSRRLSNRDITHSWSVGARSGRCFSPRAFLWPAVLETGIGVDTGDCAGLCRFGDHGNSAHRLRAIGLDASEREIEGPGMPEAAGTPARPGLADSAAGKEFGTARTAPHSTERGERSTSHSGRKRGGVRTTGVAGDREPQREPVVDRADRAVSLLDLPRADRSKFRYLERSRRSGEQVLACLLWSSPAWKMAPRDQWIGWNQEQKAQNLQ